MKSLDKIFWFLVNPPPFLQTKVLHMQAGFFEGIFQKQYSVIRAGVLGAQSRDAEKL